MNLLRKIKAYSKLLKDKRFLKKNGCTTWKQYFYKNDVRIDVYAGNIIDFYHGYKHVAIFETSRHIQAVYGDWLEGLTAMKDWCDHNCKGSWREDIHRVSKQTGLDNLGIEHPMYFLNEFGRDILFFAFTDEKDYAWFVLRWT